MRTHKICAILIWAALLAVFAIAQEHGKHDLGKVNFQNSCKPEVQESFQRSVAMLHSFRYAETERSFREVLAKDPNCAIATWGIAAILMSNPLAGVGPSPDWAARGRAAVEEGRKIGGGTQRERDYIEAVAVYYEDWANRPEKTRQLNRAKAFEALAARYPDDDEAQIFYALYLSGTQSLADQTYSSYLAAAKILEKQFAKYPDHPGAAHYLIHSYDAPAIAAKGLTAARRYANIAPAAPHALHMPSHIFTRIGYWEDSIATNFRSATAAKKDGEFEEQLHAMDYMTYAYLQMGRDAEAKRVVDESVSVTGFNTLRFAGPYAQAAIPARYAVERSDWKLAMSLEPRRSGFPFTVALTHFARALGAARTRNTAMAEKEITELARLRDELKAAGNEYWAAEIEVGRLAAASWLALAQGKKGEALSLMQTAAAAEDKNEKHIVTPGRILPAREMLGELLLVLKRPADALGEFETSRIREPGRLRGFYGAAIAAQKSGNKEKARLYYSKLAELAGSAAARREIAEARAYLAKKK
jgi:tetratricopeptide (TPR) repeat protein